MHTFGGEMVFGGCPSVGQNKYMLGQVEKQNKMFRMFTSRLAVPVQVLCFRDE